MPDERVAQRQANLYTSTHARIILAAVVVLLLVFPLVSSSYLLSLVTEILILGLFAASLDVILGYTGLVSFGHALFFGLGGYTMGLAAAHLDLTNSFILIPAVVVAAVVVALVVGFLSLRTSGVTFLMLTLAFSMMGFALVDQFHGFTGGNDGLSGISRPEFSLGQLSFRFGPPLQFYYFVLAIVVILFFVTLRVLRSPFGHALVGIRENENRMSSLGYDVFRYKLAAFAYAGVLGALAGMLHSEFNIFVSPEAFYWTTSGTVLIMVIVGGSGTLFGPVLGAGLVLLLRNLLSSYTEREAMVTGLVFILFVLFLRGGLMGIPRTLQARLSRARGRAPQAGEDPA